MLSVNGELRREKTQTINAPTDGRVSEVNVDDGQEVNVGDVLFALDGRAAVAVGIGLAALLASGCALNPATGKFEAPGGKGLPRFDYLYATSESQQMAAQAYQEMWRRELGVEVELRNLEWKVYLVAMRKGEFHLCRGAWVGDYNDPNTFLEMLTTGNELNISKWSDAEFDRLDAKCAYFEWVRDRYRAWLDDPSVELPRGFGANVVVWKRRPLPWRPRYSMYVLMSPPNSRHSDPRNSHIASLLLDKPVEE